MRWNSRKIGKKQSGLALIATSIFLMSIAAMDVVLTSMTISNIVNDISVEGSNQSRFLAQTGVEYGAQQVKLNPNYNGDASWQAVGNDNNYQFMVTAVSTTDFAGANLTADQKRVSATGRFRARNAVNIGAIMQYAIVDGAFDLSTPAQPTAWTFNSTFMDASDLPYDDDGGETLGAVTCRHGDIAFNGVESPTMTVNQNFIQSITTTAASTYTVKFRYRTSGAANAQVNVLLEDSNDTDAYAAVANLVESATYTDAQVDINVPNGVELTGIALTLQVDQDSFTEQVWVDNVVLSGPRVVQIRDVREF